MNILIDTAIFQLQQQGGISRLWRSLLPALRDAMPDATFTSQLAPDWFISTYYKPSPIGVRSLALVYDLITLTFPNLTNRADSADISRSITEASAVVSISHRTAQDVKAHFGKDSAVAYPGVDENFGKVTPSDVERFQSYIGKPYVLVVGNRGGYKNVHALYQAWALWSAHADFKVLCVGGEETLPQDAAFASRYRDTWQRMTLDDKDLALAYAGAQALVYPSLIEGFGLPMLEAMACGCPVVCDNSTVAAEVVGEAGFYADVTKPRQIAGALDLTFDPSLRLERCLYGLEKSKMFTWRNMANQVADVLRSAA